MRHRIAALARGLACSIAFAIVGQLACDSAQAFQLSPLGTAAERSFAKRWNITLRAEIALTESALHNFADPVHEGLTQQVFGCDGDWSFCADPDLEYAGPYVIAGVRWNDDPVFQLLEGEAKDTPCRQGETVSFPTQPRCWVKLFKAAERRAAAQPDHFLDPAKGNYMLRSHFGDLQFLHAMASADGESAAATKAKVLMWAEFTWGVVRGEHRLATNLKDITIAGWAEHFRNGHTVQELFTLGRPWLRAHLGDVAFGSLLHMVEDSFAAGHVDRREPISGRTCMSDAGGAVPAYGAIRQFHSYARQDHARHKNADSNESARRHVTLHDPDAITAGRRLKALREENAMWPAVARFLADCVFALDDEATPAAAGADFR